MCNCVGLCNYSGRRESLSTFHHNERPGGGLRKDFDAEGGEDSRLGETARGKRRRNTGAQKKTAQMSVGFALRANDRTQDPARSGNISRTTNTSGPVTTILQEIRQI